MVLHRSRKEVRRFNWFKWIVLLLLLTILIIMLLTGRAFDRTAVSDTNTPETATQTEATAPELAAPTFDAPAGDLTSGEVFLSGTGEPGSDVEVVVDGNVVGTAKVSADGKWSLNTDLDAGNYQLSARTLNADGTVAAEADGISLSVGEALIAPAIDMPTAALTAGAVTLTGVGTPGSEVDVLVDGVSVGRTTVGADGTWSLDADLPAGDVSLSAAAMSGGETAVSDPVSFSIDSRFVAPTINLPDGELEAGAVSLTGTGTPGSTVDIVIDGAVVGTTVVGDDGSWSFELDLPNGGDYQLSARALDADGNLFTETDSTTMTVAAPDVDVPTVDMPEGGFLAGQFALSGTGTPGTNIEVVVNGEVVGTTTVGDDGTWSFDLDLLEGAYEVAARALDANGQVIASSDSSLISINPAATALEITDPADGATLQSGELMLTGLGTPGAEIEILDNGVVVGTAVVGDDGTWSFAFEPEPGNHEYGVRNIGDETAASSVMTTIETPITNTSAVGVCDNPAPGIDQGDTYVVGECEWLIRIASRLGIEYDLLIGVNPQVENPNIIYPGQIINLPPR
ncbi:MAG: LysM peptidoglycan-binding domain-containing protein [Chloroflexi bacterium]|nr:MAG: LysM peptidoglycan-binding domain-containing protein [Chloroflexota bacterium]